MYLFAYLFFNKSTSFFNYLYILKLKKLTYKSFLKHVNYKTFLIRRIKNVFQKYYSNFKNRKINRYKKRKRAYSFRYKL